MDLRTYQKEGEESGALGREVKFTRKEQEEMYDQAINNIMHRTRWVLDNLEHLAEFQVNWESYKKKK